MTMSPPVRKLVLVVHLVLSVGWIGGVFAYLAVDVAALSNDPQTSSSAWSAMATIGWWVLVPLSVASLVTGIALAIGTPWGLFRHYWVVISLVLTIFATAVLIEHMSDVSGAANAMRSSGAHAAADAAHAGGSAQRSGGPGDFLHAIGGLVVLLVIAVLNVYKPRGLTPYGWRRRVAARSEIESA